MSIRSARAMLDAAAGLGLLCLSTAALAAPINLALVEGGASLQGQETVGMRVELDGEAKSDLKVVLRPSADGKRPLVDVPRSVIVPAGEKHADFRVGRLAEAYAASAEQVVALRASLDGNNFSEPVTITVRPGLPDVPSPCDRPAAYVIDIPNPGGSSTVGSRNPVPVPPTVVSGDEVDLVLTLDCAVRTAVDLPLNIDVRPNPKAPRHLATAETTAAAAAAFQALPRVVRVPANQRGVTLRLRTGDTLIGGTARVTGPPGLVAAHAPQARDALVVAPHPRCMRSFTLFVPETVVAGTSFTPRLRRPCQVDSADARYSFRVETSDAIALPLPLVARLEFRKGTAEDDLPLVITAGNVKAPTPVELRAVLVSGSALETPIAPGTVKVVPR